MKGQQPIPRNLTKLNIFGTLAPDECILWPYFWVFELRETTAKLLYSLTILIFWPYEILVMMMMCSIQQLEFPQPSTSSPVYLWNEKRYQRSAHGKTTKFLWHFKFVKMRKRYNFLWYLRKSYQRSAGGKNDLIFGAAAWITLPEPPKAVKD